MKAGGPPTKRCVQYEEKSLVGFFFFLCVRASVSRVTISIWLSPRSERRRALLTVTQHTPQSKWWVHFCVCWSFFLRPLASFKYYSRRWPTKSNPQRQGEWRYRLILIPLFPSTLLLSHSVCVCVMCLSSLFAMALTVKPHWKGDAAWWGSLVSGEGKNERSPPTPPALRLKKKHLIFFANEPANNDFYIVFKWPIVFGLRKCRESRKNAVTPPRVCRLLALPLLRAGQTLEMQITSV